MNSVELFIVNQLHLMDSIFGEILTNGDYSEDVIKRLDWLSSQIETVQRNAEHPLLPRDLKDWVFYRVYALKLLDDVIRDRAIQKIEAAKAQAEKGDA